MGSFGATLTTTASLATFAPTCDPNDAHGCGSGCTTHSESKAQAEGKVKGGAEGEGRLEEVKPPGDADTEGRLCLVFGDMVTRYDTSVTKVTIHSEEEDPEKGD